MARIKHGPLMHIGSGSAFPFDPVGGDPTGAVLQSPVTYLAASDLSASVILSAAYAAIQDGGSEYFELDGATGLIRAYATNGLVLTPSTFGDPGAPEDGAIVYEGDGGFRGYRNGAWVNLDNGALASIVAPVAIANTETVVSSFSMVQDFMRVGTTFRIKAFGRLTSGGTGGSSIFRCRIGTTTLTGNIPATLTIVNANSVTNAPFQVEMLVTLRTDGGSGTAIGNVEVNGGVTAAFTTPGNISAISATVVVDTTATKLIEFTYISGNAGTTATFENAVIELLA